MPARQMDSLVESSAKLANCILNDSARLSWSAQNGILFQNSPPSGEGVVRMPRMHSFHIDSQMRYRPLATAA